MRHAPAAHATLPFETANAGAANLSLMLTACPADERSAWQALHRYLEDSLGAHFIETHIDLSEHGLKLTRRSVIDVEEFRLTSDDPLFQSLRLIENQLWRNAAKTRARRGWFSIVLEQLNPLFQADYVKTSAGIGITLRYLYDLNRPLPVLDELLTLPSEAKACRAQLRQPTGLILLANSERFSRVRMARAIAQDLASPERRILLSETSCHPLVPGTTQISLPFNGGSEYRETWMQASDMKHDVIIALEIDHEPRRLVQCAAEDTLVVQGVAASCARRALSQLLSTGTRPEAVARTLTGILIQHPLALACERCKHPVPVDSQINDWVARYDPVPPGAILDWLTESLSDNFVTAPGCSSCQGTGVKEIVLNTQCVNVPRDVQDALGDGDVRFADEYFTNSDDYASVLVALARRGKLSIQYAITELERHRSLLCH